MPESVESKTDGQKLITKVT